MFKPTRYSPSAFQSVLGTLLIPPALEAVVFNPIKLSGIEFEPAGDSVLVLPQLFT